MQNKDTGEKTCSLLEKKINLFARYLSLTEKAKKVLESNEDDKLGDLLTDRQGLIHQIQKIDLAVKKIIPTNTDRFRGLIDDYINKLKNIMEMVEPLDRELMIMVRQECESTKTDLLRRQKARQAVKGYGNFKSNPAKFLNTHR